MVAVIVVVVVMIKVLAWAAAIIDLVVAVGVLVNGVLVDVEIIAVGDTVIVLKFSFPVSYSVDVPSDVAVGLLTVEMAGVILGVLPGIGVEVLADVSANAFAVVTTAVEFLVSPSSEDFSC